MNKCYTKPERSTQAGVKTLDTGVDATLQTRSTGSDAVEPWLFIIQHKLKMNQKCDKHN